MSEVKFLVFADFHYKKRMYATKVSDLEKILARAEEEKVDFIVHEGDFCNDYCHSPELFKVYLGSKIPVFGVYGNHEMETMGNTMQIITPRLTNRPNEVIWGTPDGKMGDGSIAYYYFDKEDFRFIFLDANYSLMPDGVTYEHNHEGSTTKPKENLYEEILGDRQLEWLEALLNDAADKGLRCIVNAHPTFSELWEGDSPDAQAVRKLYAAANAIRMGTVMMSINGHYHANHIDTREDVLYFDVNTVINGWWQYEKFYPYAEQDESNPKYTFDFVDYDEDGNEISCVKMPLSALSQGARTLFFTEPLSAIVTVRSDGSVTIKGSKTDFVYGIKNASFKEGAVPEISDYQNH